MSRLVIRGPADWGPLFWAPLHLFSLTYPNVASAAQQAATLELLRRGIPTLLICAECSRHFAAFAAAPAAAEAVKSRVALFRWLVDVHNNVNGRTGKDILSYERVAEMYARPGDVSQAVRDALNHTVSSLNANDTPVLSPALTGLIAVLSVIAVVAVTVAIVMVLKYRLVMSRAKPAALPQRVGGGIGMSDHGFAELVPMHTAMDMNTVTHLV